MKNRIILFFLSIAFSSGFSQGFKYQYNGRYTPVIKNEQLVNARFISEIMPEFNRYFALPANERTKFNHLLELEASAQGSFSYPNEYLHQLENYEKIMEYVSIDISSVCNGKVINAQSANNIITKKQKSILTMADLGTVINIKIKFKYKYQIPEFADPTDKVYEARYSVTIVPETEAEYPGGFKQLSNYINKNVIDKAATRFTYVKLQNLVARFIINENGIIENARITNSSADLKLDRLLIDAITKMPKWKPAQNAKGINVKQEFTLPMGGGGC